MLVRNKFRAVVMLMSMLAAVLISSTLLLAATPTITSITSTTADGAYKQGDNIDVTINFSEDVTLSGGNLNVTLDTSAVVVITTIQTASIVSTTYTVGAGENSPALNVTSLDLTPGATLRNAGGEDANLGLPVNNLKDNKAIVVDTSAPNDVTNLSSTSHTTSTWSNDNTIDLTWTAATDNGPSGIDGYSVACDHGNTFMPDTTVDTTGTSYTVTAPEGNDIYCAVRTKDNAGNWTSTVYVGPFYIDTTPPVITAPTDVTVQCIGEVPPPATNLAEFLALPGANVTDNYTPQANITITHVGDGPLTGGACGGTIARTYRAEDLAGNTADTTQTITVNDTIDPVFTFCPSNLTLGCDYATNDTDIAAWLASAMATDNCGSVVITNDYTGLAGGCSANTGSALVTFTATDDCGNTSTCQATVTVVNDTTAPTFDSPPADDLITFKDFRDLSVPTVTASDACDADVQVAYIGEIGVRKGTSYTIQRKWTAGDDCGNTTTHTQALTAVVIPTDVTVEYGEPTDPSHTGSIDELHNRFIDTVVEYNDREIGECPRSIIRTWTVRDKFDWGKSVEEEQIVTVVDTMTPSLIVQVSDLKEVAQVTMASNEILGSPPTTTVIHNSGINGVEMLPVGVTEWGGSYQLPSDGSYTVEVSGTDVCGNAGFCKAWFARESISASAGQIVTVQTERSKLDIEMRQMVTDQPVFMVVYPKDPTQFEREEPGMFVRINTSSTLERALHKLTIQVSYEPAELPEGIEESALKLYIWVPGTDGWALLEGAFVDVDAHYIEGVVMY